MITSRKVSQVNVFAGSPCLTLDLVDYYKYQLK